MGYEARNLFKSSDCIYYAMPTSSCFLDVCIRCKAYCCTVVQPPVTKKEKQTILTAGFEDHFIDMGNGIFEIKPGKNGNCPYLQNDYSCEIQSVKPQLCSVWPVVPRVKQSKRSYLVIKCPLYQYLSHKEVDQAKKDAEHIPLPIIQHLWNISPALKNKFKIFDYEEI